MQANGTLETNETVLSSGERQFIADFENLTLDPATFDHRAHVYLTWLYLRDDSLSEEQALERVGDGLRSFAAHHGAHGKYSQTITVALVRLIAAAYRRNPGVDFDRFMRDSPELAGDFRELLGRHYSDEVLFSANAQEKFMEPDLVPFHAN